MFKKNDKVVFNNASTELKGVIVGNPYRFVNNERYVEVLFYDLNEELPVNVKHLEKVR